MGKVNFSRESMGRERGQGSRFFMEFNLRWVLRGDGVLTRT